MTLPFPIADSQVDAKSPVDDQLMQAIKADLDYLEASIGANSNFDYQFKLNGYLNSIARKTRIDGCLISKAITFSKALVYLETPGDSGTIECDVRAYTTPNTQIKTISRQYTGAVQTVARAGSSLSTQSITRSGAQQSTQTITAWKSTLAVASVVLLGQNLARVNFTTQPDADHAPFDTMAFASMTDAANDGNFTVVRVNDDGGNNVVISNSAAVAQTTAAGTGQMVAWSYNYSNAVPAQFVAGELTVMASHTTTANNGTFLMYAVNRAGNNIIIKGNTSGATQGSAAGTADTTRWVFSFSGAALTTDYAVGEFAWMQSHTNSLNNGFFIILGVNSGGNNVIVSNASGVAQGGAVGTVDSTRFVYGLPSDPSANVSVGDIVGATGTSANNGNFTVGAINRSSTNNIVVSSVGGSAQGSAAGTIFTEKMLVQFTTDQSAIITTDSEIEIFGTYLTQDDGVYQVQQVNRGGGSNFNAVIKNINGVEQLGACGRIIWESKSLFDTKPSLTLATSSLNATNRNGQVSTNAVFNSSRKVVAANTLIAMSITQTPQGNPRNLVVQIA